MGPEHARPAQPLAASPRLEHLVARLAQVFQLSDMRHSEPWEYVPEWRRDQIRAGIRAVLAELDKEKDGEKCQYESWEEAHWARRCADWRTSNE